MKINYFLCWILSVLLLTGCITNKPYCGSDKQIDNVNRISNIDNPYYKKQVSGAGIAVQIGAAGAGAAVGVATAPTVFYNDKGKQTNAALNGVIGALLGYGISSWLNKAAGQGKEIYVSNDQDFKRWVEKYNKVYHKDYIVIGRAHEVISASAEAGFQVRNVEDAQIFARVFPNSNRLNQIAEQSINQVNREELLTLINNEFKDKSISGETSFLLKKGYLEKSRTVNEVIEAKNKFPEITAEAEKKATQLLASIQDAGTFKEYFPNSSYAEFVESKAISFISNMEGVLAFKRIYPKTKLMDKLISRVLVTFSRNNLVDFINTYSDAPEITPVKKEYINRSSSVVDFLAANQKYPHLIDNIEERSANLAKTLNDAIAFKQRFGQESPYSGTIFKRVLSNTSSRSDIQSLIAQFNYEENIEAPLIEEAKRKYLQLSNTVEEACQAGQLYPELASDADKRAAYVAVNLNSYKRYYDLFPNGIYKADVENKHRRDVEREFSAISDLRGYYHFHEKYKYDDIASEFAVKANSKFESAKRNAKEKYFELQGYYKNDSYPDGYRLLIFGFTMKDPNEPAFLYLDEMKQMIQIKDFSSPWVRAIKDAGAYQNVGIIFAKWYKSGVHGDILGSYSNELIQFVNAVKRVAAQKGYYNVEDISAVYKGDRSSDQQDARIDEERERKRETEKIAEKQANYDECYNKIVFVSVPNFEPGIGSTLAGRCPDGGCISYKEKTWLGESKYSIAQDENGQWWVENEFSWSGPYPTKKEAAIRQWCGKTE